jgi:hypothetical protein
MTVTNNCTICLEPLSEENTIKFEKKLSDADCNLISQKGTTLFRLNAITFFMLAACIPGWKHIEEKLQYRHALYAVQV